MVRANPPRLRSLPVKSKLDRQMKSDDLCFDPCVPLFSFVLASPHVSFFSIAKTDIYRGLEQKLELELELRGISTICSISKRRSEEMIKETWATSADFGPRGVCVRADF